MEALWTLAGLGVGAVMTFLLMRQVQKSHAERLNDALERVKAHESEWKSQSEKLESAVRDSQTAQSNVESLKATLREREIAHEQRLLDYQAAEKKLEATFKALSGEALEHSTKQLLAQSEEVLKRFKDTAEGDDTARKKEIENLLKPVRDNLQKLDEQNQQMERHRQGAYRELMKEVVTLKDGQVGLTKETTRLVKALQDPGSAGSWGEMVLERVVEMAGLDGYFSYLTQETIDTEDGKQRPDMVVSLPGGRSLIIDSKAPMRSYVTALETEDEYQKAALLVDHAKKLIDHAREMKRRDYSKKVETAPDFVVLFVPSESAYRMAIEKRPGLFEEASEFNVLIATPMALLPLLKAVAYGWQQEKLALSARQLQADAAMLYDRVCKIASDYVMLGKALSAAGKKYNDMGATLESRVLPAARKFKEHGVQTNTEMALIEPMEFAPRPLQSSEFDHRAAALPGLD